MMDYNNFWATTAFGTGMFAGLMGILFVPLMLWGIFWKGWSLWKAAHNESKVWFVVLLLLNTLGILDILYIFVFSKRTVKVSKKAKK